MRDPVLSSGEAPSRTDSANWRSAGAAVATIRQQGTIVAVPAADDRPAGAEGEGARALVSAAVGELCCVHLGHSLFEVSVLY